MNKIQTEELENITAILLLENPVLSTEEVEECMLFCDDLEDMRTQCIFRQDDIDLF